MGERAPGKAFSFLGPPRPGKNEKKGIFWGGILGGGPLGLEKKFPQGKKKKKTNFLGKKKGNGKKFVHFFGQKNPKKKQFPPSREKFPLFGGKKEIFPPPPWKPKGENSPKKEAPFNFTTPGNIC